MQPSDSSFVSLANSRNSPRVIGNLPIAVPVGNSTISGQVSQSRNSFGLPLCACASCAPKTRVATRSRTVRHAVIAWPRALRASVSIAHHAYPVSVERYFDAVPDRLADAQVRGRISPPTADQVALSAVALLAIGGPDPDIAHRIGQVERVLAERPDG